MIQCLARRIRSLSRMNYFALFLSVLWTMSAAPSVGEDKSARHAFNGPDRTITWKPWHQSPQGEYRFRTGDRYLGGRVWEHYLYFEQNRSSDKAIKLFMIHLGNEDVRDQVRNPPRITLRVCESHRRHDDGPRRRMELDCARGR